MKNIILSPFFFISASLLILMMNILKTKCSGNGESASSNSTSPDYTFNSQIESFGIGESSTSNSNSPNYTFNSQGDRWSQETVEQQFLNSRTDWPKLASIGDDEEKNLICEVFLVKPLKPGYFRYCISKQLGGNLKLLVRFVTIPQIYEYDRVMLFCTCYNEDAQETRLKDEHTFAVAYHTDTSYFLLTMYPEYLEKGAAFISGYVDNMILPY